MTRLPVPEDMKDGTVGNEQHSLLASAGAEQSEDLEAAAEVEFLQNEVHVVLHCLGLQLKLLRDLLVAQPFGQQLQNLFLARREV